MELCHTLALAGGIIGGWLRQTVSVTAQERPAVAKVLVAEEFRLVNSSGRVPAARASSSSEQPFLDLKDETDLARLSLSFPNETGFAFRDVDNRTCVVMSVDQEGFPSLGMRDRDHHTSAFQPIKGIAKRRLSRALV